MHCMMWSDMDFISRLNQANTPMKTNEKCLYLEKYNTTDAIVTGPYGDPSLLWSCWQNAFKTCYYCFLPCRHAGELSNLDFFFFLLPRDQTWLHWDKSKPLLSFCMHETHSISHCCWADRKINSDHSHVLVNKSISRDDYSDRSAVSA